MLIVKYIMWTKVASIWLVCVISCTLGSYFHEENPKGIVCKICGTKSSSNCTKKSEPVHIEDSQCPEKDPNGFPIDLCTNSVAWDGTTKKNCASSHFVIQNSKFHNHKSDEWENYPENGTNICYKNLKINVKNTIEKYRQFCTCVTKAGQPACNSAPSRMSAYLNAALILLLLIATANYVN